MKNPRSISELLSSGEALGGLQTKLQERLALVERVRAVLPSDLAGALLSAGIEDGELTVGMASSAWAARMRYECGELRTGLAAAAPAGITRVRVKVVHPTPKT